MAEGYMKWYDIRKGGYIAQGNGQPNIFVERRVIDDAGLTGIRTGQRVSYELVTDAKGQETVAQIARIDGRA